MLEISGFKPVDPSTASIQGLSYPAGDSLGARCTAKAPCIDHKFVRNDGIAQILIKVARRDHPEGIYVMLDEHINVICSLGFEIWVAKANKNRVGGIVKGERLSNVLRIGTRKAPAIPGRGPRGASTIRPRLRARRGPGRGP